MVMHLPSKAVFIAADEMTPITETNTKPEFEDVQKFCGGYVETFPIDYYGRKGIALCNDEGDLRGLLINTRVSALVLAEANKRRTSCQSIYGNVVIYLGFKP